MESPNSNYKNLASILLTNAGNSSDATIVVDDTDAAVMPAAPFYATIMPTTELANSTNSEIIFVSASSSSGGETTYTVSRGQRGTTAQSWDAGKAVMTQAVYTQDVQAQKQGYYNAALSSGSAFTITNASAPTTPVLGSRISAVFDTAITTASAITLAINGGTAYPVAVSGVSFGSVGTLTTSITVATGKVYDMIFDGTEWVIANSFGKITSDNIDWTTLDLEYTLLGSVNNANQTISVSGGLSQYQFITVRSGWGVKHEATLPMSIFKVNGTNQLAQYVRLYNGFGVTYVSYIDENTISVNGAPTYKVPSDAIGTDCSTFVYGVKFASAS